jgi:hypothetical protein
MDNIPAATGCAEVPLESKLYFMEFFEIQICVQARSIESGKVGHSALYNSGLCLGTQHRAWGGGGVGIRAVRNVRYYVF